MAEPEQLRRGKEFHRRVQADWLRTAEGAVLTERSIVISKGPHADPRRRGRVDILVDELDGHVAVVEIKSTDWDAIKPANRRKVLGAHRRQTWRYIEKYLDVDAVDVSAGIVYPRVPVTPGLLETVEGYLNDYGLQVVWYDD